MPRGRRDHEWQVHYYDLDSDVRPVLERQWKRRTIMNNYHGALGIQDHTLYDVGRRLDDLIQSLVSVQVGCWQLIGKIRKNNVLVACDSHVAIL